MIKKLKINSFKTIEAAELDLGSVNVFIGANGSGKSNLLESLGVLAAAAYGRVDEESLVRRGCRPGAFGQPMFTHVEPDVDTCLEAIGGNASYSVRLRIPKVGSGWEFKEEILTSNGQTFAKRPEPGTETAGDPKAGLAALRLAEIPAKDPAAVFLHVLSSYNIYSPDTPILSGLIPDPRPRDPIGLSGGNLGLAVGRVLSDPLGGMELRNEMSSAFSWFREVYPAGHPMPERQQLLFSDRYFREGDLGMLYGLNRIQVSEGALFLLFLGVLCLHEGSPRIFALDNADQGLNPVLARHLMKTTCRWILQSEPRQVFLTTHNPLVLDGLDLKDERIRLFTLDRDSRGATEIRRYLPTAEHYRLANEGWTLSRLWVNKLIGGVPNV